MDAMMLVREWKRMCRKYKGCAECPLGAIDEAKGLDCNELLKRCPVEFISVIENGQKNIRSKQGRVSSLRCFRMQRLLVDI